MTGYRVYVDGLRDPKRYAVFRDGLWSLTDSPDIATVWETEADARSEGMDARSPEKIRFDGILEQCDGEPTRKNLRRERWEYRVLSSTDLGDARTKPTLAETTCNAMGTEGWECFHINPGALWFKRRLP